MLEQLKKDWNEIGYHFSDYGTVIDLSNGDICCDITIYKSNGSYRKTDLDGKETKIYPIEQTLIDKTVKWLGF